MKSLRTKILYSLCSTILSTLTWAIGVFLHVTILVTAIRGITHRHQALLKKNVLPPMCLTVLVKKIFPRTLLEFSLGPFVLVIYPPFSQSLAKGNGITMTAFLTNHNSLSGAR